MQALSACALFVLVLLTSTAPSAAQGVQVKKAVETAIAKLLDQQYRDGSWPGATSQKWPTGTTALAVYALLRAGVSEEHPAVVRGVSFMTAREPTGVYPASCQLMALAELPNRTKAQHIHMKKTLELLLAAQGSQGTWPYELKGRFSGHDLSLTQFAIMGLWAARRADDRLRVPKKVWSDAIDGVLELQADADQVVRGRGPKVAGFFYRKGTDSTGSMTAAGITALAVADLNLKSRHPKARAVKTSLGLAHNWLEEHFSADRNPKAAWNYYYYLFGLERAASLLEARKLGGHEWYPAVAKHLVSNEGKWNGDPIHSSFVLLFLTRATGVIVKQASPWPRWGEELPKTEEWMVPAALSGARNVLRELPGDAVRFVPSSNFQLKAHGVAKVWDGSEQTSWRWDKADDQPFLELHLTQPVSARTLVLTSANSRPRDLGNLARATKVSVQLNNQRLEAEFDKNELRPLRISLGGNRRVRDLVIVVKGIAPGRNKALKSVGGFAEVALER